MFKKRDNLKKENRMIDIDAGMEAKLKFNTPVNLRINGRFKGELETKGSLIIGENADVDARIINGENITVFGKVKGDIVCSNRIELSSPARVTGNIRALVLVVKEGAMLKGKCQVPIEPEKDKSKESFKKKKRKKKA